MFRCKYCIIYNHNQIVMIYYKRFVVKPIEENCYVLWDDTTGECGIVDCGAWSEMDRKRICDFIQSEGIKPKYLLQTHMHFDHCLGLGVMSDKYRLVPMCHAMDLPVYRTVPMMVQRWLRQNVSGSLPEVDACIVENMKLNLGETQIQVLHTPGHTPGGVCYYIPAARLVFTGDTLFRMSLGRTDLPGGDIVQELDSIRHKLLVLPPDTVVLPGHGPESSIGAEQESNPYLI